MIPIDWPQDMGTTTTSPKATKREISAAFAEIARKHGLPVDASNTDFVRWTHSQTVVDILVGDDVPSSQILDNENERVPVLTTQETGPIMIERNALQINRSTITFVTTDNLLIDFVYVGKSSIVDEQFTGKRFLKLQDKLTGRTDVWNGMIAPKEQIRYGKWDSRWWYNTVRLKIDMIAFKY